MSAWIYDIVVALGGFLAGLTTWSFASELPVMANVGIVFAFALGTLAVSLELEAAGWSPGGGKRRRGRADDAEGEAMLPLPMANMGPAASRGVRPHSRGFRG